MVNQSKRNSLRDVFPFLFFSRAQKAGLTRAIANAELKTSAELRVRVEKRNSKFNILEQAEIAFIKLGMHKTALRNGVLILVCPNHHEFAVLGDQGIHERVPEHFWEEVAEQMRTSFEMGRIAEGVEEAIARIGKELERYFPRSGNDQNELSNKISS